MKKIYDLFDKTSEKAKYYLKRKNYYENQKYKKKI